MPILKFGSFKKGTYGVTIKIQKADFDIKCQAKNLELFYEGVLE